MRVGPTRPRARRGRAVALGILALLFAALLPTPLGAGKAPSGVLILSSLRIRPYELLARRMAELCRGKEVRVLYLDEEPGAADSIPGMAPSAIVTVGQDALRKALPRRGGASLVYTMVLSPRELLPSPQPGVAGVAMVPSPRQELLALMRGFGVRKLAVFSNPKVSGPMVKEFQSVAPEGLDFEVVAVRSEGEMLRALGAGLPKADGVLLIPDTTLLTEDNLRKLMAASYAGKVPVFGFSPLYLELGAAATLSVSEEEVAGKALSIALATTDGPSDQVEDLHYLRSCVIHLNGEAVRRLGLKPDRAALSQFGRVVEKR